MNLLKSQVQRQQQIEQVGKNAAATGSQFNYHQVESKSSPTRSPPKKGTQSTHNAQLAMHMVKQTPRNLQDVPSAYDIRPEQAPKNLYNQSAMARMAEEKRMYDANKKNSSYRKILDGIQKMSALHSDVPGSVKASASSKGFKKPYKPNIALAQTFYDEGIKIRGSESSKAAGTSFKIRTTGKYRPNITAMKSNATMNRPDHTPSRTERHYRKADQALSSNQQLYAGQDQSVSKRGFSPSGKLLKPSGADQHHQRPITEQTGRTGGNQTQRAATDISEYFMPKKRIQQLGGAQQQSQSRDQQTAASSFGRKATGVGGTTTSQISTNMQDLQHTVTAFYQHLSDKQPANSKEIDQLTSIIRPQKVAQHQQEQERMTYIHKSLLQRQQTARAGNQEAVGFALSQETSNANRAFPSKRQQQNELIFQEIFVQPKQEELAQFKQNQQDEVEMLLGDCDRANISKEQQRKLNQIKVLRSRTGVNHSNMLNESNHAKKKANYEDYMKRFQPEKIIQLKDGGNSFLEEIDEELSYPVSLHADAGLNAQYLTNEQLLGDLRHKEFDLFEMVINKFNMSTTSGASQGCFSQQIRMQPPDILKSIVQNPLGNIGLGNHVQNHHAPAIPLSARPGSIQHNVRESAKDLIMKAKAGIQQGDFMKETHINFQMGELSEKQGQLAQACQYYKRFYLCARVLNDDIGSALALNRLAVVFFKRKKFDLSYMYHGKHAQQADENDQFVAIYNAGISSRLLGEYHRAAAEFEQALQISVPRNDLESMSLCYGQLAIANLLKGDMEEAQNQFQECINIAKELRAVRMQLECLLCMAYISFDKKAWEEAQTYFDLAYNVAKECSETHIAEQCLCNSGIASGNAVMQDKQKMFSTFYSGALKGGFGGFHVGTWSEEDEEDDEDEEAEYDREDDTQGEGGQRRRSNAHDHFAQIEDL